MPVRNMNMVRVRTCRRTRYLALGLLNLTGSAAWAQSQRDQSTGDAPAAVQPTPSPALPVQTPASAAGPHARFDALAMRGWERPLPKSGDTLIGNAGGLRDALADAGIGFIGFANTAIQYNMFQDTANYRGKPLYNGQKLTRNVSSFSLFATYDLGRVGIENGQFIFSAFYTSNNFNRIDGPNTTRIGRLAYYQSLFNKKLEFKIGYFDNGFEFLGTQTGGSLAGGTLGPQASVPNEVGLSYSGVSTPTANLRINFKSHYYTKLGVQRSLPPGGATPEVVANPSGLRFHVPGTGDLLIDEWGWDRPARVGESATWVRLGGIYNSTNFAKFLGGQSKNNWAAYIAADRQLSQFDDDAPNRGLYVGATINVAPPKENFIARYYEARVYGVGLAKSRPFDLASIVATVDGYSKDGLSARTAIGDGSFKETYAVIASYAYRVHSGVYFQPGLGAVIHPVFSPRLATALNGYLTISFFL